MTTTQDAPEFAQSDVEIVRELARRYMDVCRRHAAENRAEQWRALNSLRSTRPLIYTRAFAWREMPDATPRCADPFLRGYEDFFRNRLFWDSLGDDSVFTPWVTVPAVHLSHADGLWGVKVDAISPDQEDGAKVWDHPVKEECDIEKLVAVPHRIDEAATRLNVERLQSVLGDIIEVSVDRAPLHRVWNADISTQLGYLRGIEQFMLDVYERPEWLHRLLDFICDTILRAHQEAEDAGDWRLCDHENQQMPYADGLAAPAATSRPVKRSDLWSFCAAQEWTCVGPEQFDEFLFSRQERILNHFGLVGYGCCEDLTRKIDIITRLPNLRRIAVPPAANVAANAERIGSRYVISYRPSPADMVSYGFDEERISSILRRDLAALRGLHFDITLKDVETVERDPARIRQWVALTRRMIDEVC